MRVVFSVFFILLFSQIVFSQELICDLQSLKHRYDHIIETSSEKEILNKSLSEKYRDEIIVALSFFPELKDTRIQFKRKRFFIRASMTSSPSFFSVFRKKEKRKYVISINNRKGLFKGVRLDSVSFAGRVGVLGHELCHVVDYESQDFFELIKFGVLYSLSSKEMKRVEHETDLLTLKHGLGCELWHFKKYIFSNIKRSNKYRKKILEFYMTDQDVYNYIEKDN